ncbi:unnamed protein product, partial [Symbiodinium microadriaticum]
MARAACWSTMESSVSRAPSTHPCSWLDGLLFGMVGFYALAIWATIVAPSKASGGSIWFLTATKFLLFRFRSDFWWFGTFMLPRGLMLSLSIVAAGDSPYVQ